MNRVSYCLAVATTVVLFQLFHCYLTNATTYVVGDDLNWTGDVSMETWPNGKTFFAGDILEFHYDQFSANVAIVNETGYETCTETEGTKVSDTGFDKIQLGFGVTYFICSMDVELCALGFRMAVNATSHPAP